MIINKIEELGFDKNHKVSSQSVIKSGPNRGFRVPEKDGEWICTSGHNCYAKQQERFINYEWSKKLIDLGFRVGKTTNDGCANFYIFKNKESKK